MSTESEQPPRLKRESVLFPIAIWKKMSVLGKSIAVAIALLGAGASGYGYMDRYAMKDDLAALRKADDDLSEQLRTLSNIAASNASSVQATQEAVKGVREDVRTLLQHMLARPPRRAQP